MNVLNFIKQFFRELREQFKMLTELWKTVPADCRGTLVEEFVFNPHALKRRYHNEQAFKSRLDRRWQKTKEE